MAGPAAETATAQLVAPAQLEIGRVRIRHDGTDPGLRARAGAALRRTDLTPSALSPSAVLVVRRVHGSLPPGQTAPAGHPPPDRHWHQHLRAELASLLTTAARPQHGRLPLDAPAVLFADRAELVACVLATLLRGGPPLWWKAVLFPPEPLEAVDVLARDVAALPGAFDLLERWDLATQVMQQIDRRNAVRVLSALARTFALVPPASPSPSTTPTAATSENPNVGLDPTEAHPLRLAPELRQLWQQHVGEATPPGLMPEPAMLLVTSLLLHRAPGVARTPGFARLLDRPWDTSAEPAGRRRDEARPGAAAPDASTPEVSPSAATLGANDGDDSPPPAEWGAADHTTVTNAAAPRPLGLSATDRPQRRDDQLEPPSTAGDDPASQPAVIDSPPTIAAAGHDTSPGPTTNSEAPATSPDTPPVTAAADDGASPEPSAGLPPSAALAERVSALEVDAAQADAADAHMPGAVRTQLAGVFYLVNLINALQLLEAVESQWRLTDLSGWALLDGLARALLDDRDGDAMSDPLWALLADLDGRSPEEPLGFDIDPLPPYVLPLSWWAQLDLAQPIRWAHTGEVWRVWTPEVVLVEAARPREPIRRIVADYTTVPPAPGRFGSAPIHPVGPLTARVAAGTRRWLQLATPFLRQRLALALDTGPNRVADAVRIPGDVHASRTHIDVVMDLQAVSVPVRLAGLDRDPGWVPRLGRVVSFRFNRSRSA